MNSIVQTKKLFIFLYFYNNNALYSTTDFFRDRLAYYERKKVNPINTANKTGNAAIKMIPGVVTPRYTSRDATTKSIEESNNRGRRESTIKPLT